MLMYLGLMTVEFDLWYTGAGLLRGDGIARGGWPASLLGPSVHRQPDDRLRRLRGHRGGCRGAHSRLANPSHERPVLSGNDHPLSPKRLVQRWAGRRAPPPQLLHDVLPERGRLFARRPACGPETRHRRRAVDRSLGNAALADADLPHLFPVLCDQVPGAALVERHVGPLRALQS